MPFSMAGATIVKTKTASLHLYGSLKLPCGRQSHFSCDSLLKFGSLMAPVPLSDLRISSPSPVTASVVNMSAIMLTVEPVNYNKFTTAQVFITVPASAFYCEGKSVPIVVELIVSGSPLPIAMSTAMAFTKSASATSLVSGSPTVASSTARVSMLQYLLSCQFNPKDVTYGNFLLDESRADEGILVIPDLQMDREGGAKQQADAALRLIMGNSFSDVVHRSGTPPLTHGGANDVDAFIAELVAIGAAGPDEAAITTVHAPQEESVMESRIGHDDFFDLLLSVGDSSAPVDPAGYDFVDLGEQLGDANTATEGVLCHEADERVGECDEGLRSTFSGATALEDLVKGTEPQSLPADEGRQCITNVVGCADENALNSMDLVVSVAAARRVQNDMFDRDDDDVVLSTIIGRIAVSSDDAPAVASQRDRGRTVFFSERAVVTQQQRRLNR